MSQLEFIRGALDSGDLDFAARNLMDVLYSSSALDVWMSVSKSKTPIHNALSFIREVKFDPLHSTAYVDTLTLKMYLGVKFFNKIESLPDLFYILFHERGHVLLELVYGSWIPLFQDHDFGNIWEDQYINNTIGLLFDSDFPSRVYSEEVYGESLFFDLLCQNFTRWVGKNLPVLTDLLSPKKVSLLRKVALLPDGRHFSRHITYPQWMDIGKEIESISSGLGGDTLSDFAGEVGVSRSASAPASDGGGTDELGSEVDPDPGDDMVGSVLGSSNMSQYQVEDHEPSEELKALLNSFSGMELPKGIDQASTDIDFYKALDDLISSPVSSELSSLLAVQDTTTGRTGSLRSLHRRDVFYVAAGYTPTTWTQEYSHVAPPMLKLYFDVSGSMTTYYPLVSMITKYLGRFVDEYFQFSNSLVPVKEDAKYIHTSHGTNYNLVARHIVDNGYKNVIVVTDNTMSIVPTLQRRLQEQLKILVLLQTTDTPSCRGGFFSLATHLFTLPSLP